MLNQRPQTFETADFNISRKLYTTLFGDNKNFACIMPMAVKLVAQDQPSKGVLLTGSVIFEDIESGEVRLSIFRSDDEQGR